MMSVKWNQCHPLYTGIKQNKQLFSPARYIEHFYTTGGHQILSIETRGKAKKYILREIFFTSHFLIEKFWSGTCFGVYKWYSFNFDGLKQKIAWYHICQYHRTSEIIWIFKEGECTGLLCWVLSSCQVSYHTECTTITFTKAPEALMLEI